MSGTGHPSSLLPATATGLARVNSPARALAASPLQPSWFDDTASTGPFGGGYQGAVAYDPFIGSGALVYYGGCTNTQCPSNATWIYQGEAWFNETLEYATSPGPLQSQSMDFDPAWGGVISAGGYNAGGDYVGTWLFNSTGWYNISAMVGFSYPMAYDGAMAWDPALHALVYVDGCAFPACGSRWTTTFELTTTWTAPLLGPGGIDWAVVGESLAFDAADQSLLLFGGFDGTTDVNYTFELTGTGWVNLTATAPGCDSVTHVCGYYPLGRAYAEMTWDGQIGAIVLYGGFNSTAAAVYGDSWQFQGGTWLPSFTYYAGSLPDEAITEGVMAVNSTDIAPMVFGGVNAAITISYSSFAFEALPNLTISIVNNPTDAGSMISINVSVQAGSGSGPWVGAEVDVNGTTLLSVDRYGINFTTVWAFGPAAFSESTPGTYPVVAAVDDWVYGIGYAYANITVDPTLVAHASANVTTTEVGLPVSFTGSGAGGSGSYSTFAWTFMDGDTGTGASTGHSFVTAGTYHVQLSVTDTNGVSNSTTVTVHVLPLLAASVVTATPSSPAVGTTVTFGVTVTGGDTPYTTYAWNFGDGTTGSGAAPTHSFTKGGTFTVSVTVTDSLGVKSTAQLSVTVPSPSSSSGGFSLTSGTGLYLLLGVIVVIVVVGALLLMRRKETRLHRGPPGRRLPLNGSGGCRRDDAAPATHRSRSRGSPNPFPPPAATSYP